MTAVSVVSVSTASLAVPLSGSLPALSARQRRAVYCRAWGWFGCGFGTLARRWLPRAPDGQQASGWRLPRRSIRCWGWFPRERRHLMRQHRRRSARRLRRCHQQWSRLWIVSRGAIDLRISCGAIDLTGSPVAIDLRVGVALTVFLGAAHFRCCFAPGEPRGEPVPSVEQTCRSPHVLIRLVVNTLHCVIISARNRHFGRLGCSSRHRSGPIREGRCDLSRHANPPIRRAIRHGKACVDVGVPWFAAVRDGLESPLGGGVKVRAWTATRCTRSAI